MIIREKLNIDTSFKDFIKIDESETTSRTLLADSEILENVHGTSDGEEDSIDIKRVFTPPKKQEKPFK